MSFEPEGPVMRIIVVILFVGCAVGSCSYANRKIGQPDDWFVEEFVERIIENETGISIDLTPGSPE